MPGLNEHLTVKIIDFVDRRRHSTGEVGLEIEVEGRDPPNIETALWLTKHDGSLRGNGVEYIFNGAKPFAQVDPSLKVLCSVLKDKKFGIEVDSPRTSVHVHLNVQSLFVQQVYSLICLYLIFEDFLTHYSGPDRVGNMYCLRYSDAEYLPLSLIKGLQQGEGLFSVFDDNNRYSSLNLKAVQQFGSVEFRTFRGSIDRNEINDWISILWQLLRASKNFNSPLDVIKAFDEHPRKDFCHLVWGGLFERYIQTFPDWQTRMHRGYLYSFEIAHALRQPNKWHPNLSKVVPKVKAAEAPPKLKRGMHPVFDGDDFLNRPEQPPPLGLNQGRWNIEPPEGPLVPNEQLDQALRMARDLQRAQVLHEGEEQP